MKWILRPVTTGKNERGPIQNQNHHNCNRMTVRPTDNEAGHRDSTDALQQTVARPRFSPDLPCHLHYQLVQHSSTTRCHGSHRSRTEHRSAIPRTSHVFISTRRGNIPDSRRNRLGKMGPQEHFSTRNVNSFPLWSRRRTLSKLPSTPSVKISARTWSCLILRTCDRDSDPLVPPRRGGASLGSLQ